MTGTPKPRSSSRRTMRRIAIGTSLGLPALLLAIVMPMQAVGQPSAVQSPGDAILTVFQEDSPDPATEGENVTYVATVGNDGAFDATDVWLQDFVSDDVDFVSATSSQGECFDPEGSFYCNLGTIGSGGTATVTLVVTTTDRCTGGGGGGSELLSPNQLEEPCTVFNDVDVSSPDSVENAFWSEATVVEPVGEGPSLSISKSDSPDPVQELNPITYTIDIGNFSSEDATGVVVTDSLPPGTTFNSVSTTQGSCSHTATTVTCNIGTLVPSESQETVTIIVVAPNVTANTLITNEAEVSASNAESETASEDTLVTVNAGGSTDGEVPPNTTAPLTFTTATQSKGNGAPAVNGGDKTAVSLLVPAGGPGGSLSLDEIPCATGPCTGPAPSRPNTRTNAPAAVVLGGVVFDIVPPEDYPNNKPFRVTLLYDKTLNPTPGPVYYFKQGVTANEITLRQCGSPGPRGKAPCIVVSKKIQSNNALTNGDWKVIVKIVSDPRMRR